GWLKRILAKHGSVLAEPWLERLHDFSAQLRLDRGRADPVVAITRFLTDHRGSYRGHVLGRATLDLDPARRRDLASRHGDLPSLQDAMLSAAAFAAQYLADIGYSGPASLDMFVFREPHTGKLCLRAIGEINPRFTMGHVALSLAPRLVPEAQGLFV